MPLSRCSAHHRSFLPTAQSEKMICELCGLQSRIPLGTRFTWFAPPKNSGMCRPGRVGLDSSWSGTPGAGAAAIMANPATSKLRLARTEQISLPVSDCIHTALAIPRYCSASNLSASNLSALFAPAPSSPRALDRALG